MAAVGARARPAAPGDGTRSGPTCLFRYAPAMHARRVSVVIPVHNEAESVAPLADELAQVAAGARLDLDVIFVDDGSTDATWRLVCDATRRAGFRAVRLCRRLGKSAALRAGLARAVGDVLMTMDGDLQDDPADIPAFLAAIDAGADMVVGWKRRRRDRTSRILMSRSFNCAVRLATGLRLHDENCGYKAFRPAVRDCLWLSTGMHRYLPAMTAAAGMRVDEIEVHHRARRFGRSKYGLARVPRAAWDFLRLWCRTRGLRRPAAQHLEAPPADVADDVRAGCAPEARR